MSERVGWRYRALSVLVPLLVVGAAVAMVPATAGATQANSTSSTDAISGTVIDNRGQPVEDATVRVPLPSDELVTQTSEGGTFRIDIGDRSVPGAVTVIVEKRGYLPSSRVVEVDGAGRTTFRLGTTGQQSVLVTSDIYHLGDGDYGGQINSNFQKRVDGESETFEFDLNDAQDGATGAVLTYTTRGVQSPNEISINGREVGTLEDSPDDGSADERTLSISPDRLESGENTLEVDAVESSGYSFGTDLDDFEISNIRLQLRGVPPDEERPEVSAGIPDSTTVGATATLSVSASDNNRVQAVTATVRNDSGVVTQRTEPGGSLSFGHQFSEGGTYEVQYQAVDQSGNRRTGTETLAVQPVSLAAAYTESSVYQPDEPSEVTAIVRSSRSIEESVPVTVSVDGSQRAATTVDGLTEGLTTVTVDDISLSPGEHEVVVTVDPDETVPAIRSSPTRTLEPKVSALAVEQFYTEPTGTIDGETTMQPGNTGTTLAVHNPTDEDVTGSFTLRVDGEPVSTSSDQTVEAGDRKRLYFPWNAEAGASHDLELEMTADGETFRLTGVYRDPAEWVSRPVPTELVHVETNDHMDFDVELGYKRAYVNRDTDGDTIDSLTVPVQVQQEMDVTITALDSEQSELGSTSTTVTPDDEFVDVPLSDVSDTDIAILEIEEQGSFRGFMEQVAFGISGGGFVTSTQEAERTLTWRRNSGDAPTYYYNSLSYEAIAVVELSGYPASEEFESVARQQREEGADETYADALESTAGLVAGLQGKSQALETGSDVKEFVGAAADNAEFDMPSGDASVDVGDASFTNDGEVGTVEMYEYEGQPSGVGSPNLPGHRTKIQYYDLRTTGLTDGDAELELEYDERQLRQSHIDEGSVELQYWQDGEWQSTEVDRNPDDDTIETEVPVEDLSGTVFVLSGREMSQEEIWLDQALRLYDEYTAPVVGALAVVLVGLFMLVQRLRRFRG